MGELQRMAVDTVRSIHRRTQLWDGSAQIYINMRVVHKANHRVDGERQVESIRGG